MIAKTSKNTWMGREGTSTTFAHTAAELDKGNRVVAIRWADTGEVSARHIEGDGRFADFQQYDERTFPAGTPAAEIEAYAAERLA